MSHKFSGQKVDACGCTNLELFARGIAVFNDTSIRRVIMQITCADCGSAAEFVAIPHDAPPDQPSTSADGREVYLPIRMIKPERKP